MDDFDMSQEEDFESLYAQELELMNELTAEQEYEEEFTSSLKIDDSQKHTDKDTSNPAKTVALENSFIRELHSNSNNENTIDGETDLGDLIIDEDPIRNFDFVEKDPSSVKKRIFEEFTIDPEANTSKKRRKTTLPEVGYEVQPNSAVDPDLETIDRILSHRKLMQNSAFQLSLDEQQLHIKKKCSFHRRIPNGDFQSLTSDTGARIYLTVEDESSFEASVDKMGETKEKVRLLSVPYQELRNEAEKELLRLNSNILCVGEKENSPETDSEDKDLNENELWVNLYRPRSYLDLLSDESTNRTVLHWMKLWDKIVFGRSKVKLKEKPKEKQKFFSKFAPEVLDDFDEIGRPMQKAVLLCGPPGLGKTTLAHIIASHAGYNAVEMNASDDRSVETFRTNLENATTMKSVFGADKRPNCLIIDEIDGAPSPAINFLVNLLQAKKVKNDQQTKKKDKFTLFRPVICICNDLYVPSLRPLRQISLVIQFPPTHSARLAQRLHLISKKQSMKADLSVLLALCNKTENDIRSCLSVLQFVRISSNELKFLDLKGVSVGQKDYQRSLFSVWHDIFTLPRPKRAIGPNPHLHKAKNENSTDELLSKNPLPEAPTVNYSSRFGNILRVSQSCGEYDKLTQGWFENYLNMKFKHTYLEPVVEGLDWATMTDLFQKEIHRNQTWNLGAYIPFSFVAYHYLFASNTWPKLQFPNQFNEFSSKISKTKSILDILMKGMSACNLFYSPSMCLVQDILPFLTYILQPNLRAVNVQLFSNKEREELNQLVNTMISYNLTYQQEKSLDGTYTFTIDPNIEEVVNFPTIPKPKGISYSSKQLIAREIELEKVRKSEQYFNSQSQQSQNNPSKSLFKKAVPSKKEKENSSSKLKSKAEPSSSLPNHLQKLEAKKIPKIPTNLVAKDFFGRVITTTNENGTNHTDSLLNSNIWFKFKEGYSNAVRRPFKVKNFFD